MSCCAPGSEDLARISGALPSDEELVFAAHDMGDGTHQIELSVPRVHCGACIHTVESALHKLDHVERARVNLSTKRVSVRWRGDEPPPFVQTLDELGYTPNLFDDTQDGRDPVLSQLLRALAVCGFAASNVMLLSVGVWSGADGATRDLFHWISALIAIPALVMGGGIFYRSAWSALRHGYMNMDVPIAVGITMAYALSIYDTWHSGQHAYFDASVTLLFFLLIGRTLDHVMRSKARAAVTGLARLSPRGALVLFDDGSRDYRPIGEVRPGMRLLVAAGERIPVDARILQGASDLDCALVSGESTPLPVSTGNEIQAGTLNLTGPLTLEVLRPATSSFLAEMMRLMEAAEGGRALYRRIADRVASLYAPVLHLTALITFIVWMLSGSDWHQAATIAIAVLIITCPCALGLAVPIVQVVAARRLFENGIMVKDGAAMERLAQADTVIFDKTGTLTLGQPRLTNVHETEPKLLEIAAALATHSRHPLSQAIAAQASHTLLPAFDEVKEHPGFGMEATEGKTLWRLGRASWAANTKEESGTVLSRDGEIVARFTFEDEVRPGARAAIAALKARTGPVEMLSGDTENACRRVAATLGIDTWRAALLPAQKVERIEELSNQGRKVLMVGDGLNDAPALSAAHVSIAPATAADIGRNAADFVFLREDMSAVTTAIEVAKRANQLIRQNIGIAVVYNFIAIPIAIAGYVTPLIAAIAMSGSSIIVIFNALRLMRTGKTTQAAQLPVAAEPVTA
ncbi:cation-translocating P-type ATPase [Aquamicrobium segne]|uniref:Cation-translocating P-type ATPase n=1 Tax=Aquamicrobium segne TaxID=469547 RepID=A0ABW0GXX3_9HYPH